MSNVVKFHAHSSMPKSAGGAIRPTFLSARLNGKNRRAGKAFSDRQLETACAVVPSSLAAANVPPSASIASSAVSTSSNAITHLSTVALDLSTLQGTNIASTRYVDKLSVADGSFDMGSRLEILARVRQLGDVLDKKEAELAEICGVTPQQWSNYRSDTEHNNEMPARVALVLWDAFGIPMEWIYDGQTNRVPNPDMREKLVLANRRAAAWIASRHKPSPRGHMTRIAIVALTGAIYFWCGGEGGQAWQRTSGSPIGLQQEYADRLACRGEARDHVEHKLDSEGDYAAIYIGCMTEKGYVPKGEWPKP